MICIAISGPDVQAVFRTVTRRMRRHLRKPVDPGELAQSIALARGSNPRRKG